MKILFCWQLSSNRCWSARHRVSALTWLTLHETLSSLSFGSPELLGEETVNCRCSVVHCSVLVWILKLGEILRGQPLRDGSFAEFKPLRRRRCLYAGLESYEGNGLSGARSGKVWEFRDNGLQKGESEKDISGRPDDGWRFNENTPLCSTWNHSRARFRLVCCNNFRIVCEPSLV